MALETRVTESGPLSGAAERAPSADHPAPDIARSHRRFGLTSREVRERAEARPPPPRRRTAMMALLQAAGGLMLEPLFLLLFVAAAVYLTVGERTDALVLVLSAVVAAAISVFQRYRTDRVLDRLRELSAPRALVLRDGEPVRVATIDLVRGDCLILGEGDRIAADAELVDGEGLSVDESLLTGESAPVTKMPAKPHGVIAENVRNHRVFAGTMVVAGSGLAIVTALGRHTEFGQIGEAVARIDGGDTPLRRDTHQLAKRFAAIAILLCVALTVFYALLRADWNAGVLSGLTLAMAILPEEFPLVITVFLALGAWRVAQAGVLARRNDAIEALGAVNILCVDKTGTLTENRMRLAIVADRTSVTHLPADAAIPPGSASATANLAVLACNPYAVDPMDRACLRAAPAVQEGESRYRMLKHYPMRTGQPVVAYAWESKHGQRVLVAKGAPESMLALSRCEPDESDAWLQQVDQLAERGLRVLALAQAAPPAESTLPEQLRDVPLTMVALLGFQDPLRKEVPAAIAECRRAGVRVIMITGDYAATARQIAREAGFSQAPVVLNGADTEQMDNRALQLALQNAHAVTRVTPLQKLRMVHALLESHGVVGMTGDGVNDAPALKAATIGIAMGKRGSDVAREAAGLVLVNDDFASIVVAMRAGRRMFANLRHALQYVVAVHVPIVGFAALPLLFGVPPLLMPIHVMFFEFVIDPACSVVFEAEPEPADLMQRPPRSLDESVLSWPNMADAFVDGAFALAGLLVGTVALRVAGLPDDELRAAIFAIMVVTNLTLIFVHRARVAGRRAHRLVNWPLRIVTGATLSALALVLVVPGLRAVFHFAPLSALAAVIALAAVALTAVAITIKHRWGERGKRN